MRFKTLIATCIVAFSSALLSQENAIAQSTFSYSGPAVAVPDNNATGVNIPLTVSGLGNSISDLDFRFDTSGACDATVGNTNAAVSHTFVGDLTFKLTSPSGTSRLFMVRRGGTRENICLTNLNDQGGFAALSTLTSTTGTPVSGNFSPEPTGTFAEFNGLNPNGTWTLNVTDSAGVDTGSVRRFSLIITAPLPCSLTCPANITTGTAINQCSNVVTYPAPTTSGACGTVTCVAASGSSFPKGLNSVTCSATAGPSCSFNVTVNDTQPPTITCPASVTVDTDNDSGATVNFGNATATDNCPGLSGPTCSASSGAVFPVGNTSVNCTAGDASGSSAGCTFNASVNGNVSIDSLPGQKPSCLKGAKIKGATLVLTKIGGAFGDESVSLTGKVKFKNATYAALNGKLNGAQIQLEDTGNSATLYELSGRTRLVPGGQIGASTSCGPKDGWQKTNRYANGSNKLGMPACIDKSANGLQLVNLSSRDPKTKESVLRVRTRNSRILEPSVRGPFVATLVFGSNAQGNIGQCAVAKFRKNRCVKKGAKITCSN